MDDDPEEGLLRPDDETDKAMNLARQSAFRAAQFMVLTMGDDKATTADRLKAAQHILEMAGCLPL